MGDRIKFFLRRLRERLWVKPLAMCIVSVIGAYTAKFADQTTLYEYVPNITPDSIETLLRIIATSMLVIATFAVSSMVSAYASAENTATPRAFSLIISDDVSQNALSTFIGSFIFSIVALVAMKNEYYGKAGNFALFSLTLLVFAIVIFTFVRWVDLIARLGRLGETINKIEEATSKAMNQRLCAPSLRGMPAQPRVEECSPVLCDKIGYVQRVDVAALQEYAEKSNIRISVAALPGTFASPDRPVAYIHPHLGNAHEIDHSSITKSFNVGSNRKFDEDPRFGLIALSEIACRALSPGINDPGTAIGIIGRFVRLFSQWNKDVASKDLKKLNCDRVDVPEISEDDMFDDAFSAIARDGAEKVEVMIRLLKGLNSLAKIGSPSLRKVAERHAKLVHERALATIEFPADIARVKKEFQSFPN